MVTRETVGARIREVRTAKRKTLKDVEAVSGFSSTHISEIERGRTSPTVGALIRIAQALDKDPSFFIEERILDEVCVTSAEDRPPAAAAIQCSGSGYRVDGLTRGVLGGRMLTCELIVEPSGAVSFEQLPEFGDLLLYCVSGQCDISVEGRAQPFHEGDSLHLEAPRSGISVRGGPDQETFIVVIVDPQESVS